MSRKNRGRTEPKTAQEPTEKWSDLDNDLDGTDDENKDLEDLDLEKEEDPEEEEEEEDLDDDVVESPGPQFYTVLNSYDLGDETIKSGQKIEVQCQHCAMWKRPLAAHGGKVLCRPGEKKSFILGDDIVEWEMRGDRYSCQQHFVPMDLKKVVDYLIDDVDTLSVLRYAFPIATAIAKTHVKFARYCDQHNVDSHRADELLSIVSDFAYLFATSQQIEYVRPLISYLAKKLKIKHRRLAVPRKAVFSAGDDVVWTDPTLGTEVSGFIRMIGGPKKKVSIIVVDDDAIKLRPELEAKRKENPKARIGFTYECDVKRWLDMNPKVVSEAVVFKVDDETQSG